MNITLGVLFAVLGSFFYAFSAIPRKFAQQKVSVYMLFSSLGFLISALMLFAVVSLLGVEENLFDGKLIWMSSLCGLSWALGSGLFFLSVDRVGLSRSTQWKNLQGPFGVLLIFFVVSEVGQVNFWLLLASIFAILISALLFSTKEGEEKKVDTLGILYALLSAVVFGATALTQKILVVEGFLYSQQVWFAFFAFLFCFLYVAVRHRKLPPFKESFKKDNAMGLLGGALYLLGSLFVALAYLYMSGSVAFTIVQLNGLWTILLGMLLFKEIDFKKNWKRFVLGFIFVGLGVGLLSFA